MNSPLTLSRRMALLTAVLAILLVAGSTEIGLQLSERARLSDLEEESVDLATTLAAYLTRIAPTGEPSALLVGISGWSRRHITETTAIVFVIVDNQLVPAAASDSTVSVIPSGFDRQAIIDGRPISWFRTDSAAQEVAVPLGAREFYGVLHVTVSTGRLAEWADAERKRALLLALTAALLVAIGVALLTTRWVGRPLASLTRAMAGAHGGAEGSRRQRPEVGPPEFRLVARRYNDLREALVQRERESEARAGLLSLEERARSLDRLAQAEEIAAGLRPRDRYPAQHHQRPPAAAAGRPAGGRRSARRRGTGHSAAGPGGPGGEDRAGAAWSGAAGRPRPAPRRTSTLLRRADAPVPGALACCRGRHGPV